MTPGRTSTAWGERQRPQTAPPWPGENHVAENMVGYHLIGHGEIAAGLLHLENAVRIEPGDVDARDNLGWTLASAGPSLTEQAVTLHTAKGFAKPKLTGSWFGAGFHGAMAELLLAIEERRGRLRYLAPSSLFCSSQFP